MAQALGTAQALEGMAKLFSNFGVQAEKILEEIAPKEREIESVKPEFFNNKFREQLKLPILYRYNNKGARHYFDVVEPPAQPDLLTELPKRTVRFFPSVTTISSATLPTSYAVKQLIGDLGMEGFNKMMREKALYGTLLHQFIGEYIQNQEFTFSTIPSKIELYREENRIDFDTTYWNSDLRHDLLSLIHFIREHEVDPIAIEIVGTYDGPEGRFAGAIDLLCEMTIEEKGFFGEVYKTGEKKGDPKESKQKRRITAIVDFKSGKKGFYESHEIQLGMYRMIAEQSFGIKIDKIFDVSPSDWETNVGFKIKDQSDAKSIAKIPALLAAYAVDYKGPADRETIEGTINGAGDIHDLIKRITAEEFVLNQLQFKNQDIRNN